MSEEFKPITQYAFFSELTALPYIDAIYLFGSRARAMYTPEKPAHTRSDVDLAILCPDATNEEWLQVEQIIEDADILLSMDAKRLNSINETIFDKRISRERVPLFVRATRQQIEVLQDAYINTRKFVEDLGQAIDLKLGDEETLAEHIAFHGFRITFIRFWKLMRRALHLSGLRTHSAAHTLKHAYMEHLFENRYEWEELLQDWNLLRPNPSDLEAPRIFAKLPRYHAMLKECLEALANYIQEYHPDFDRNAPYIPKTTAARDESV